MPTASSIKKRFKGPTILLTDPTVSRLTATKSTSTSPLARQIIHKGALKLSGNLYHAFKTSSAAAKSLDLLSWGLSSIVGDWGLVWLVHIHLDGFEYAGVRREQNATYLAKVVSALYTDDFSSQGLGVELPEKTTALGKCYLIGVKLDIPAMRRAALEKLKGLERLYTDSGVILDVMELVYGKQEMVEEEFRMWLGDMGEYIFGASEETLVEIHSGEVGRRVEQLIIEGGDLGIDLEGLRERYRGGNVRPEASRAVESLVAVRERYSIESSRPRGPRVPAEVDELPDDSQEVNSLEII